jgi:hypothetical protein
LDVVMQNSNFPTLPPNVWQCYDGDE